MQDAAFFRGTFDETMGLLVEARNYMRYCERRERKRLGDNVGLRLNCEAMRVTSRLTQVMAWLIFQKAIHVPGVYIFRTVSCQRPLVWL